MGERRWLIEIHNPNRAGPQEYMTVPTKVSCLLVVDTMLQTIADRDVGWTVTITLIEVE